MADAARGSGLTRRSVLVGAAAACLPVPHAMARAEPSLKAAAAGKGIAIGSAYDGGRTDIEALLSHHCDVITPENALKASNIVPNGVAFADPNRMDAIASFCRREGLDIHGHTLHWHHSFPAWLEGETWAELTRAHRRFLRYAQSRYDDVVSWDVINEPFSDLRVGYRDSAPLRRFGDDFLHFLFRTARTYAPNATLVLNDYNLSCGDDFCARKRDVVIATIDRLLARGTPIDAIGVQAHIVPTWPPSVDDLVAFARAIGDRGLQVFISEMDVNDVGLTEDVPTRDAEIAGIYRDVLQAVLPEPNVTRLTFWGLTDAAHWIVKGYAPFQRESGTPRPALFDDALRPKPAFYAVLDVLNRLERHA